jgi:hypothetical protein
VVVLMVVVVVLVTLGLLGPSGALGAFGAPTGALVLALSTPGLAVVAAAAGEGRPQGPGRRS